MRDMQDDDSVDVAPAGSFPLYDVPQEELDAAVARATFSIMEDDQSLFATIPGFPGVWARGRTSDEVTEELRDVLHHWLSARKHAGEPIPVVNEIPFHVGAPV